VPGTFTHMSAPTSRLALSALAPETLQSEIRAMTTECDRTGGINLAQGVCDTPVPEVVETAAIAAIRDGQNIYTRCDGIARLREAIAAKQLRDYGLTYDAENEVIVASGATAGLHAEALSKQTPDSTRGLPLAAFTSSSARLCVPHRDSRALPSQRFVSGCARSAPTIAPWSGGSLGGPTCSSRPATAPKVC